MSDISFFIKGIREAAASLIVRISEWEFEVTSAYCVSVLLLNEWRLQTSHSSLSLSVPTVPCDQRSPRLSWWLLSGPRESSSSAECSWRRCVRSDKRLFTRETKMWVDNLTASSIHSRHNSCREIKVKCLNNVCQIELRLHEMWQRGLCLLDHDRVPVVWMPFIKMFTANTFTFRGSS